jgi:hypothetical protein
MSGTEAMTARSVDVGREDERDEFTLGEMLEWVSNTHASVAGFYFSNMRNGKGIKDQIARHLRLRERDAGANFQAGVGAWMLACFNEQIARDVTERNHRFLEEALELVQAGGCTASEAHQLVDYVYGRPVGELGQEIGGVMVTLAALCDAHGLDMKMLGDKELARVWTKIEVIRAKQAGKPKHSPLPAPPDGVLSAEQLEEIRDRARDYYPCSNYDNMGCAGVALEKAENDRYRLLAHIAALSRTQGDWVPWKPGDALPEHALYWTTWFDREYTDTSMARANFPRDFAKWGVTAYLPTPLPPPFTAATGGGK